MQVVSTLPPVIGGKYAALTTLLPPYTLGPRSGGRGRAYAGREHLAAGDGREVRRVDHLAVRQLGQLRGVRRPRLAPCNTISRYQMCAMLLKDKSTMYSPEQRASQESGSLCTSVRQRRLARLTTHSPDP